jgi:hypothetical protein
MTMKNIINVMLTTQSRLFIADAAKSDSGLKYVPTTTANFLLPVDGDEGVLSRNQYPIINANLLRGRLRRNIARRIIAATMDRGDGISVDMAHLLTCLATSAAPSSPKTVENALNPEVHKGSPRDFFQSAKPESGECEASNYSMDYDLRSKADPFVAMFGGGPNNWKSRLVTTDFIPNDIRLNRPELFNSVMAEIFTPVGFDTGKYNNTRERVSTVKNDDVAHYAADINESGKIGELKFWLELEMGSREVKAKKAQAEADGDQDAVKNFSKSNIKNMMTVETVIAGTPFVGRLVVEPRGVSEEVFAAMNGLLLLALDDLCEQQLGGNVRNGWGAVKVEVKTPENNYREAAMEYISKVTYEQLKEAFGVATR